MGKVVIFGGMPPQPKIIKKKDSPGKKKRTKKNKGRMEPTRDFWSREGYIKRRTNWLWRLKPFVEKMNEAQCGSCQMKGRCNRVPLDEVIMGKIINGEGCPDHKSLWKGILGKDDEYDWGF